MKKIICCPRECLPERLENEALYCSMFSSSGLDGVGHTALQLPSAVQKSQLSPSVQAWDFAVIASAVAAADKAILRKHSPDGWTREINLDVSLSAPDIWNKKRSDLEKMLRFLTGDFWSLEFSSGGVKPPKVKEPMMGNADCVCLLSGGIDSLVGAIDLTAIGMKPLFVSHVVRGDKDAQSRFASVLGGSDHHFQWSFTTKHLGISENSTRARSMIFFAFATLAVSAVQTTNKQPVDIYVPENGFISLNVPLGPGRLGSLSTKTTHPFFMNMLQEIWNDVGIPARLILPYLHQTKGEMLQKCQDIKKLIRLVGHSTSCGRYQRNKLTHCGTCIPCLVRRAAFLKADLPDSTVNGYIKDKLSHSDSVDVSAAAMAYLRYKDEGIHRFTTGSLTFAPYSDHEKYERIVARGLDEIGRFLSHQGIL